MQDVLATRWSDTLLGNWRGQDHPERTCCLICIYPADRLGQMVTLADAELTIGREAGCDLELVDDSVSRKHAMIRPSGDGFVVVDLNSTNGTFVNDTRVDTRRLDSGDRLRFGNQIFKYLSTDRFEAEYFENAYRMMTTDGLTQVYNRRYLSDMLQRELRRGRRTGRPLSLLMVDLDRFKSINDTYGHLTGDLVLIELSCRLQTIMREDDVVARFGGEEFCLLLPETSLNEALVAAERVRAVVGDQVFNSEQQEVPVTVSIGVACAAPSTTVTPAELIDAADQRLYEAKRTGRNRVVS